MQKISEFDLNKQASTQEQESSENNSMEQQRENHLDNTDMIESGSDAIIVNSNANNNGLIQDQLSLPEENQAAANKERKERIPWTEEEHRLVVAFFFGSPWKAKTRPLTGCLAHRISLT
ncbi:hypothetical protein TSUD_235320 [Trifolium subterraneum]|uniref:Uncharacterized protein n=1 Tax=Trifolium subterraneum TaxID=3900 RepID=A0A2Z6NKI0_TRISU|nr:hypothetical protein TSUD_235320 [Trifolium subterraneum]